MQLSMQPMTQLTHDGYPPESDFEDNFGDEDNDNVSLK